MNTDPLTMEKTEPFPKISEGIQFLSPTAHTETSLSLRGSALVTTQTT